ncbi:MAG: FtsX-like permease family protein [Clostridia bacterium]|nr:FtsX-like permease family protein [Clostridia bacterium]
MVVSVKDGLKLIGVTIICFCAVFVCTFMLNYYIDVKPLGAGIVDTELSALYFAQVTMAKFTSIITGGVLGVIAAVMIVFYVKLYIDGRSQQLGIIKAMGYSRIKIALGFWVFGLSVFIGCALGFAAGWASMDMIYGSMTIDGVDEITPSFHAWLMFALVLAPAAVFTALACGYAYFALRRPVMQLIRGASKMRAYKSDKSGKDRNFLTEMSLKTLGSKKLLVFFIAFSCFCFSAMVQMGLSIEDLASATMGYMILAIGLILAAVTMIMSITSLINSNAKNIALMKAFGYTKTQRTLSVLGGFIPFAFVGFVVGTVYQYGLLKIMVNVLFADVAEVPDYNFNVPVFFITFAAFVVCYTATAALYSMVLNRFSVKKIMTEI